MSLLIFHGTSNSIAYSTIPLHIALEMITKCGIAEAQSWP